MTKKGPQYTGKLDERRKPITDEDLGDTKGLIMRAIKHGELERAKNGMLVDELLHHYRINPNKGTAPMLFDLVVAMAEAHKIPAFREDNKRGRKPELRRIKIVALVSKHMRENPGDSAETACNALIEAGEFRASDLKSRYFVILREEREARGLTKQSPDEIKDYVNQYVIKMCEDKYNNDPEQFEQID